MGRFTRKIRKSRVVSDKVVKKSSGRKSSEEVTVTYRWSDELEDYVKVLNRRQKAGCSDLRDYTYETRPAGLERMKEEEFKVMQENSPYFYEDMDGKFHFLSEWKAD